MVGKFGFLCVGAVVLGSTFAMPSSSELEKVKAEVDAIVKWTLVRRVIGVRPAMRSYP